MTFCGIVLFRKHVKKSNMRSFVKWVDRGKLRKPSLNPLCVVQVGFWPSYAGIRNLPTLCPVWELTGRCERRGQGQV